MSAKELVKGFEFNTGKIDADGYSLIVLYALSTDGKCLASNEHRADTFFNHSARWWKECEKVPAGSEFIGNYETPVVKALPIQ